MQRQIVHFNSHLFDVKEKEKIEGWCESKLAPRVKDGDLIYTIEGPMTCGGIAHRLEHLPGIWGQPGTTFEIYRTDDPRGPADPKIREMIKSGVVVVVHHPKPYDYRLYYRDG